MANQAAIVVLTPMMPPRARATDPVYACLGITAKPSEGWRIVSVTVAPARDHDVSVVCKVNEDECKRRRYAAIAPRLPARVSTTGGMSVSP
jgi:hypothetical protein